MIADKYIYLLLSLGFFVSALLMLYHREWRKPVMAAGLLGAVAALLVAGFYYADYWRPPTLRGVGVVSFEDALFGFGVAALALCVYGFFEHAHPRNWALNRKHVIHIGILAVVTLGAFVTLTKVLQLNSIVASYTVLMITPGFILIRRHRLWRPMVVTGVALVFIAGIVYSVLFGMIDQSYVDRYFLLVHSRWNPVLFGFYPLTEVIWYFLWGFSTAGIYPYIVKAKKEGATHA